MSDFPKPNEIAELIKPAKKKRVRDVAEIRPMVTKDVLRHLAGRCQRCSMAYNDPHLIETCAEISEPCWEGCPACFPDNYQPDVPIVIH